MTPDIAQFTTATAASMLAVAGLVSLLKAYVEAWWLPPTAPLHDTTVRVLAIGAGILVTVTATLVEPRAGGMTGPLIFAAVVEGVKAAAGAIVTYHVVTSSIFDALGGSAIAPGPGATVTFLPPVTHTSGLVAVTTVPPVTHAVTPPLPAVVPVPPPAAPVLPASEELVGVTPLPTPPITETPPPPVGESGAAG